MKRILSLVGIALLSGCLVKYTYNQTGPEYPDRTPFSPVEVFMDTEPPYPVESLGTLAFTDPLPRKIQIEEAKRLARQKGGNVIVRIKNDLTESDGGFTFRIARVENLDQLIQARRRGGLDQRFGSGFGPAGGYDLYSQGEDEDGSDSSSAFGEPAPFTYYPD